MLDPFNRRINYLRISVTDRCNMRCEYCMPETGVQLMKHEEVLSFEEIAEVVRIAALNGIDKIRLTGGEPLIRRDILELVKMISHTAGVVELAMTSNGLLLEKFAQSLVEAGLQRVNISLDTIDPEKFRKITRGGDIEQVFKGIDAAKKAGLHPVKINCVVMKNSNEEDAIEVSRFCEANDLRVRFIHRMNLMTGEFSIVEGGEGGNCNICNRLRLTSNGLIKPCLFSDIEYNIREIGIKNAIEEAVKTKPECGTANHINQFHNIGG